MKKILLFITFFLLTACAGAQPAAQATHKPVIPKATFTAEPTPTLTLTPAPTLTPTPAPTLPPGVNNVVHVNFFNSYRYYSYLDTFTNREVDGFFHAAMMLDNIPDDSSAPVYGLGLEFSTAPGVTSHSNVRTEFLELMGPPVYKWFFGDVPEVPEQSSLSLTSPEAYFDPEGSFGAPFTPGFDASISVDKSNFSEPDAQVVTLTIVPRQKLENLSFIFHLSGGYYRDAADAVITSLDPGEHRGPAGERILVSPDRKDIDVAPDLPLTINEPYSFTMTLRVDPSQPNITYKPYTAIAWIPGVSSDRDTRGTILGNMLTVPVENVGIWTWTANGEYLWEWQGPGIQYEVSFN